MGGTPARHFCDPEKNNIRVVTDNTYKSHTEPLFKEYGLLNVNDMFLLNKLKFLHKLFRNNLPVLVKHKTTPRSHIDRNDMQSQVSH